MIIIREEYPLLNIDLKRSLLLALIDEDLNGIKVMEVIEEKEEVSVSFMDKALSFLKTDQQQDG